MDLLDLLNDNSLQSKNKKQTKTKTNEELLFYYCSSSSFPSSSSSSSNSNSNLSKIKELLLLPSLNLHQLFNGLNCFHITIKKKKLEILELLLNYDFSLLSSQTSDQRSSLMISAYEGQIEILNYLYQQLLTRNKNYNINNEIDLLGNTTLHYASWGGSIECIQYCVETCLMNPLQRNKEGMNSLQFCSAGNHLNCLQYLEEYLLSNQNTSISTSSSQALLSSLESETGLIPLHRACLHNSIDIVTHLLQQIEVNNQNKYLLHENIQEEEELKNLQIQHFSSGIFSRTYNGNTSLHLATQNNSINIIKQLLQEIQKDSQRFPFLYKNAKNNLSNGIDIQNQYGLTPLHFACIGYVSSFSFFFFDKFSYFSSFFFIFKWFHRSF